MKYQGSIIAGEILADWNREKYLKSLHESKKRFKCKIDNKMQCDACKYKDNCEDKEE